MTPKGAPKRIYLQLGPEPVERGDKFSDFHDVTWCVDRVDNGDIEYVRADIAINGAWTQRIKTEKP